MEKTDNITPEVVDPNEVDLETPEELTLEAPAISEEKLVKERLYEAYNQIAQSNDPAEMTAIMISLTEEFGYGLKTSNMINDRQGKNRMTVAHNTYRLNEYTLSTNVDIYRQQQVQDMVVSILNTYLSNKQVLPTNLPKKAAGIENRVKALYINLFNTNNYGFIGKLATPPYMKEMISKVFKLIKSLQEDAFKGLVEYLETHGEFRAVELVKSSGYSIWGSPNSDTNDAFYSAFGKRIDILNDRVEVERVYVKFRALFVKSTKSIGIGEFYDIFDLSKNSYDTARKNVFRELTELASDEGRLKIINSILYER